MGADENFATSDSVTCVVLFGRTMRAAVREAAGIGMTGYRILAYLGSHDRGATPGELARMTGLSSGTVSSALNELREHGLVSDSENASNSSSLIVRRTRQGDRAVRSCDEALSASYEDFFEPIGERLRADLLSGSLVTTAHLGVTRIEGNSYFAQYSVLIGFLKNEQHFMNTTRSYGLGMGEYRVLLALLEHPSSNRPSELRRFLVAHKSEVSSWCKSLESKGLVIATSSGLDKRGKALRLSAAGSIVVEDVNAAIDIREVRPVQDGEIALYNGMFRIIVDCARNRESR